ncbi:MAG: hypothetical protein HY931_04020 [Candidatus Falkowbacteria bacterium]|nr:MAG: hypothetical protein HY931_04020 [Candidatus Falkowbacteria bacterium]
MCILPGMSDELGRRVVSNPKMKLIRKRNRLVMLTQNISGGFSTFRVVPFKSKQAEELFVLEKAAENAQQADRTFLYMYLTFCTRTVTYCLYGGKKIQLEDKLEYEAPYIFDEQSKPGNELFIIPAKELAQLTELSNWGKSVMVKVQKNPEKMCLLCYGKSKLLWLDKGYTLVSSLRKN